jgi:tetratricopeptide (TPR) repeat protein
MRWLVVGLATATIASQALPGLAQEPSLWSETLQPSCAEVGPLKRNIWSVVVSRFERSTWVLTLTLANRAVAACQDDPELLFLRARLLYDLGNWERAVVDLTRTIELDPDGTFSAEASFTAGVALTRLERFEEASRAYRRFLDEAVWPRRRSIALTNLAETHMALDELDVAHQLFVEAVATDPSYSLAYFGLAVVLDRIGEQGQALDEMLHGLSTGRGFDDLTSDLVFYVPAWEIHYYRALAHEALGEPDLALTQWQSFLDRGGSGGPYADRVRAHIARLMSR